MKYSIRTKLLILIMAALIVLAITLGGTSIFFAGQLTDDYARKYVSLLCDNKADEINAMFSSIEQSVNYMSINACEELSNPMNLTDEIYYESYIDKMRRLLWNTGSYNNDAIAVYLRLNPDICGPTSGIFMTRRQLDSEMEGQTPTDLSAYSPEDVEHVGWYYQPINVKRPVWMTPYYNQNIDVYMISYVVPMYKNDTTIGVLGMDINFNYITERVKHIKVYDSGYAYITGLNDRVIYHPTLKYGAEVPKQKGWKVFKCSLDNGMILNITVPISEINQARNGLMRNMLINSVLLVILFILITIFITNRMIAPLQKLNQIAIEISGGNYDVDFNFKRPNDEIGQLADSFANTVSTLKEYTAYINGLAYKDSLTGVRNRTAYDSQVEMLEAALEENKDLKFAIAVFDVNNLKKVNDSLGHEKGDELIREACKIICKIFSHSAVFRIGGDEFAAIIRDANYNDIDALFDNFKKNMEASTKNNEPEKRVSVAYGWSAYEADTDNGRVESVFKRADEIMYEKKKQMKGYAGR